jgi:hypothetical protein
VFERGKVIDDCGVCGGNNASKVCGVCDGSMPRWYKDIDDDNIPKSTEYIDACNSPGGTYMLATSSNHFDYNDSCGCLENNAVDCVDCAGACKNTNPCTNGSCTPNPSAAQVLAYYQDCDDDDLGYSGLNNLGYIKHACSSSPPNSCDQRDDGTIPTCSSSLPADACYELAKPNTDDPHPNCHSSKSVDCAGTCGGTLTADCAGVGVDPLHTPHTIVADPPHTPAQSAVNVPPQVPAQSTDLEE